MKNIKRIIIGLFIFVAFLFVFTSFNAKADPVVTSSEIQVTGASVRTAGNAGIRFVGTVGNYDTANVKAYGIAIAFGEQNVEDILLGATVGGKSVLTATDTALDGEGKFYIVLYGVPEASYAQDVTARAYVVLNDDSVVYSTASKTRNLAQVAIQAKNDGFGGGLIDTVVDNIESNYKAIRINHFDDIVSIGIDEYEKDPFVLRREFLADFNAFAGKSLTASSTFSQYNEAMKSTSGTAMDKNTDVTDSKLYQFFKDSEMGSKWGWFLDYLDGFVYAHLNNQIKAIKGDGTKAGSGCEYNLYRLYHIIESVYNFFNMKNEIGYPTKGFTSKASYGTITSTIKIDIDDYKLCKVGSNYNFSALVKNYYDFDGYMEGESLVAAGTPYVVKAETKTLTPQFSPTTYTITYYDGFSVQDLSPSTYNVESVTFNLPELPDEISRAFLGWSVNSDGSGTIYTSIENGEHGNRVYYAVWNTETICRIGETEYLSINQALSYATDGAVLELYAGTHNESFSINNNNITIKGPNYNIDPNTGVRSEEAILAGTITIAKNKIGITFNGLKFISGARIINEQIADSGSYVYNNKNLAFNYNIVNKGTDTTGIINITNGNRVYTQNVEITHNYFTGNSLTDSNLIFMTNNENMTLNNNVFENINKTCFKIDDTTNGKGESGNFTANNNVFRNIGGSAIWVDWFAPKSADTYAVEVGHNIFDRVDGGACVDFEDSSEGASYTSVSIHHNIYRDVYKCYWGPKFKDSEFTENVIIQDNLSTGPSTAGYVCKCYQGTNKCQMYNNLFLDKNGTSVVAVQSSWYGTYVTSGAAYETINAYKTANPGMDLTGYVAN